MGNKRKPGSCCGIEFGSVAHGGLGVTTDGPDPSAATAALALLLVLLLLFRIDFYSKGILHSI